MPTISAELRQEIEQAGDDPVRIEDPQTHTAASSQNAKSQLDTSEVKPRRGGDGRAVGDRQSELGFSGFVVILQASHS